MAGFRCSFCLALIVAGVPSNVNAGKPDPLAERLLEFALELMDKGKDFQPEPGPLYDQLDLKGGEMSKVQSVRSDATADSRGRDCHVVISAPSADAAPRPIALLFLAKRKDLKRGVGEGHWFRVDLDGKLEKALLTRSRYDDKGRAVEGSGTIEPLDVASRKVGKMLQYELDFWLRGRHRKKT